MLGDLRHLLEDWSEGSLQQSLTQIMIQLKEQSLVDAASTYLVDEEKMATVLVATDGLNPKAVSKAAIPFGQGIVGNTAFDEVVNLADALQAENYYKIALLQEDHLHGYLALPLTYKGDLIGALVLQKRVREDFDEQQVAHLMTFCLPYANQLAKYRESDSWGPLFKPKLSKTKKLLKGMAGSAGVAMGKAVVALPQANLNQVLDKKIENIDEEIVRFEAALDQTRKEIEELKERASVSLTHAETVIFDAYLRILDSRSLLNEIEEEIGRGQWAQGALRRVMRRHIQQFENLEDDYIRERASDIRDLGERILAKLNKKEAEKRVLPKQIILFCHEVTPTLLMEFPAERLKGVVSGTGSSNSHAAILARAMGVPAVMGAGSSWQQDLEGSDVIVDGYEGMVYVRPPASVKKSYRTYFEEEEQITKDLELIRELPAVTTDEHPISLYVNTGLAVDAGFSLGVGAKGVGLYRSEMPFMLKDRFPGEEEQRIMYRQLLSSFAPHPVVMRTLDIGGDKALDYFPIVEDNPFLGWRGMRVTLDHPEILRQQVSAMMLASQGLDNLAIMLPMISSIKEVEQAMHLIHQVYDELIHGGLSIVMPHVGVMIEVPAAVYQARSLAKQVDFLSVGSNDLIQYLLAVDRNNPRVADLYDGLHPAVLQALQTIVDAGHKNQKQVSLCGELASDPAAVPLLVAMGYDNLSMNATSLLRMKWVVRSITLRDAQFCLKEVMKMEDAREVRGHMEAFLEQHGLGGLIRAGF